MSNSSSAWSTAHRARSLLLAFIAVTALGCARPGCAGKPAAKSPYVRAEIFYIDWDLTTAAGIAIEGVRLGARSHKVVTAKEDIAELVWLLAPEKLAPPPARPERHG